MARAKKKSPWALWRPTIVVAAITLICGMFWPDETANFLRPNNLGTEVLVPMLRLLGFVTFGLLAALLIETLGWTVALGRLAAPLASWAHLPQVAVASFITALVSNPAANAMLSEALEKKTLSPRALLGANLLNGSWPSFIVHLPSTLVVATSFAGRAGLAYVAIMFTAATLRLVGAAFLGRLILPPVVTEAPDAPAQKRKPLREIWPDLRKRLTKRVITLLSVAAPIFFLITYAANLGLFAELQDFSATHFPDSFLPVEAATLIVFSLTAEFSSGFVAAGALLQNNTLTMAQAAAALVIGNIIATPIRVIRWQLAAFIGFFQLKLALILILCNQAFRVISLITALFIFWQIFGS